jgi:hypothetical protein
MPKAMEQALKRSGRKKGLSGEHLDAYVYGTMREKGWRPAREKNTGEAIHESEASSINAEALSTDDEDQYITVADTEDSDDYARPGVASDVGSYKPKYKRVKVDKKLLQSLQWAY